MMFRRAFSAFLTLVPAALASGCGFHPLYAPGGAQSAALQSVFVNIIPNRDGQLLRQALQERLEGTDAGIAKRYTLTVYYSTAGQTLGVQSDNSVTRLRNIANATWILRPVDNATSLTTSGKVRSVDGYNIIDEQYFQMDLSGEAVLHRLADAVADQIVTGLAIYFSKHPEKA